MSIFNYRYRWYSWISQYSRLNRFFIMFSPLLALIILWYFFCYKSVVSSINGLIIASQKSNKECAFFYELREQVFELGKELEAFTQEKETQHFLVYEKMLNALGQAGISVLEFQQSAVISNKPISITMKLLGSSDAVLKLFCALREQSLFFVIKSCEIATMQKSNNWTVNVQGELFF